MNLPMKKNLSIIDLLTNLKRFSAEWKGRGKERGKERGHRVTTDDPQWKSIHGSPPCKEFKKSEKDEE